MFSTAVRTGRIAVAASRSINRPCILCRPPLSLYSNLLYAHPRSLHTFRQTTKKLPLSRVFQGSHGSYSRSTSLISRLSFRSQSAPLHTSPFHPTHPSPFQPPRRHLTVTPAKDRSGGPGGGKQSGVIQPQPGGANPTDIFTDLNVSSDIPPPSGGVDRLYHDGFLLNNGVEIVGDGVLILHNEAFRWNVIDKGRIQGGVLDCDEEVWGALEVVAPKPELLILGTGANTLMMSEKLRARIHNLGIRVDAMDTNNAAAEYNMLATERSGENVAAAFFPLSFR